MAWPEMPLPWIMLLLLFLPVTAQAKTLWVVLVPGTNLTNWRQADAPYLHQILATGSVALMNTRTARTPSHTRETPESAALTLGAGSRAAGGPEATDFLPQQAAVPSIGVTAGQLYTRRMGLTPPPGSLVNPEWPRVLRENARQGYDLHPGDLADALHGADVSVIAGGGLLADAVAASGTGWIAPTSPSGGGGGPSTPRCIIWDAGSNLERADLFLGSVMAHLGSGRLIVLSATAGDAAYARGNRLCPVAVWGRDVPPGLLYSASTRRAGLVTDTDFATTAAAFFGVKSNGFAVRPFGDPAPWTFRPVPQAPARLALLNAGALRQWDGMRALPYLALFLGGWMLGATLIARRRSLPQWAASIPPAVLLALLLSVSPLTLAIGLAVAAGCVFVVRPWGFSLLLGSLLVADMACGDPLMRQGLLGYSAIEGARYYGIGNEAMGALIGASLVATDAAWQRLRRERRGGIWLGLLLVTALIGSPLAGAKAGGLLVALAAFGIYAWLRSGQRLTARVLGIGGAGIIVFLLAVAFLDARLSGSRASHFGQAAARLSTGGLAEWGEIIHRKLAVEGHLLWHSAWAVPVWGGLLALAILQRRLPPDAAPLFQAGLVSVAACLTVNDAGGVAGALCLAVLWSSLIVRGNKIARRPQEQAAGQKGQHSY